MTRIFCAGLAAATALLGLAACSSVDSGQADAGAPADASAGDSAVRHPADADAADSTAVACSRPLDCPMHLGSQVYCCTDNTCGVDVPDACADGAERPIQASNYDQSCTTDMDCVAMAEGNACSLISPCANAAINRGALAQYQSDIAQAPCYALAGCPAGFGPCCRQGSCQMNTCYSTADTLPACADAGGACAPFVAQCGSKGAGPPDACAYPDETCCLQ
jgi:hypothetical protein